MNVDLAYDVVNLRPGGGGPFTPHCRVRCSTCVGPAALLEFALPSQTPPEHVAKKIRSKGWEFDLRNRRHTHCPECIRLRDAKRAGESPGPKQVAIELFGKKVELPATVVPPELHPAPPPVREPVVFKHTKQDPIIADAPPIPTSTEMVELIAALKDVGKDIRELVSVVRENKDVRDLVGVLNEMMPKLLAAVAPPLPSQQPIVLASEPMVREVVETRTKSPETRRRMAQAQQKNAEAYTQRVREGLKAVRNKKSNGREPSIHEYIRGLTAMGIRPYRPDRPWTPSVVQRHLEALDHVN